MNKLLEFWGDKDTKNDVQEYLINYLKEEGIRKLFDKEDVSAVAEAKEMIDKAFEHLDVLFEKKKTPKDIVNEAR
jgi:hypothetical protein